MKPSMKRNAGFTLIELMIVVAIIGILSMLAMTGYKGYMASAKSAEAKASLGDIGKLALASYEKENNASTAVLAGGASSSTGSKSFCGTEAALVPATVPKGIKYQSQNSDWAAGAATNTGFTCLGFSMQGAQYFSYGYQSQAAVGAGTFQAYAIGDLNGNNAGAPAALPNAVVTTANLAGVVGTTFSGYGLNGAATAATGATIAPAMVEVSPTE